MSFWPEVLGGIRTSTIRLAAGKALFRRGDEVRALYRVEQGCLCLCRSGIVLHRAKAGSALAEASLFRSYHDCDALAESACRVRVYSKAAVLLHLRVHPDINLAFSAALAREVEALRAGREVMRLPRARDRVLAHLVRMGAGDGLVTWDRTLTEMAEEIGLTHEALYRTLAALAAEGKLERPGKRSFRLIP